jgi:hypothetical protein
MNYAMREPVFVEFAEECLKVINPGNHFPLKALKNEFSKIFGFFTDSQKEEPTDEQIVDYIREKIEN